MYVYKSTAESSGITEQFRWQHKVALWPGEESALFRRVCPCVRFFEQSRVCTHFQV